MPQHNFKSGVMKLGQFNIRTMLVLTMVAAMTTAWLVPFAPNIEFGKLAHSSLELTDGSRLNCYELSIRNSGSSTIWLAASSTSDSPAFVQTFFSNALINDFNPTAKDWYRVEPGQSIIVKPIHGFAPRLSVLAADWRGRNVILGTKTTAPPPLIRKRHITMR